MRMPFHIRMDTDNSTSQTYESIPAIAAPLVDADIVIPVYNEEAQLADAVIRLVAFLQGRKDTRERTALRTAAITPVAEAPFSWNIVIADNASTDATWGIAHNLVCRYPGLVRAIRLKRKGRGYALKTAWSISNARVRAYMDVDLSTSSDSLNELIVPLLTGQADIAIGSRLAQGANVQRSFKREFISRSYNFLLRSYLRTTFRDAQCGFKAITAQAAQILLPAIEDNEWLFDTELLTLAQYTGMRLNEIPVHWIEDTGSTVDIVDTATKDLAGMRRIRHAFAQQQRRYLAAYDLRRAPEDRGRLICTAGLALA